MHACSRQQQLTKCCVEASSQEVHPVTQRPGVPALVAAPARTPHRRGISDRAQASRGGIAGRALTTAGTGRRRLGRHTGTSTAPSLWPPPCGRTSCKRGARSNAWSVCVCMPHHRGAQVLGVYAWARGWVTHLSLCLLLPSKQAPALPGAEGVVGACRVVDALGHCVSLARLLKERERQG